MTDTPEWLLDHRESRPYYYPTLASGTRFPVRYSRSIISAQPPKPRFLEDIEFNRHSFNDGSHVSPYDGGKVWAGLDGIVVRLTQGIDEEAFKRTLNKALKATTGIAPDAPEDEGDWDEMMRGGLQAALESQVLVFEVHRASRALTHQLVRSRKAGFHQQSQRATFMGDRPDVRWPESIVNPSEGRTEENLALFTAWETAQIACWDAYKMALDQGLSYQDARFILPEGTVTYIQCEYSVREFINVFAYRGCSMFMWEMVGVMREMRRVLLEAHPFLEPYVKISCEKGTDCELCKGTGLVEALDREGQTVCGGCNGIGSNRKCTFQGWESVERQCDFPWALQENRVFLPAPKFRIGEAK